MEKIKILFWLNAEFSHFAIAYFLQKQYDAEFYAVIDITNKPKKFFEQQTLVKFEKVWYFHDYIDPSYRINDTHFLKTFEQNYDLNLWKMLLNERIFYNFFDFHKFSESEMLSITEQSGKLFEKILDTIKPDFIISQNPIHFHAELFYQMARKKNVKCLLLSMPKLAGKYLISEQVTKIDYVNNLNEINNPTNRTFDEILSYLQNKSSDKTVRNYVEGNVNSKFLFLKSGLKYLFSSNSNVYTHYTYYGRTKFNVITKTFKFILQKKFREFFMKSKLITQIEIPTPFVYFPMSVDMERNVLIDAPFYTNQIEMIRIVAKSLPVNYKLVVKENPAQVLREWRPISDYNKISSIPNVILVHPSVRGQDLIRNSSLVISLAGASPLEANFYGKPSIVFGNVVYSLLPCVLKVTNLEDLPVLIKTALSKKVETSDLNRFIDLIEKNTVNFTLFEFETRFNSQFFYGGGLFDVVLEEEKVKDFLDGCSNEFKDLISEYIKKMQQHKQKSKEINE